ncbi:MAG: glucose-1-phosphate thymidylyltransferase [Thermofilaceae archaeon]
MKGVILHGGAGTRLRPLTFSGPKQLIEVAGKPVSQWVLEDLVSAGVREVAIVLGDVFPELVVQYYGDGSRFGARVSYVHQGKPLGIAHAVGLCRDFVGSDSFVVYLGDNLLQHGIKEYVRSFVGGGYDALVLLKEVEDPTRFGVAQLDERGRLVRLVEKPKSPPSNLALVGVYFFKSIIFKAIDEIEPSWRSELEITDALQKLIDWGCNVGYRIIEGWWLDTGKKDDILTANYLLLDGKAERKIEGEMVNSRVEGRVTVCKGARIVDSTVRGPAFIGEGTIVEHSFIGPYTSLSKSVKVVESSLEYCVVLEGAWIESVERMEESLVGRHAKVVKRSKDGRALRLNIGDYSEVYL